jgi:serine protease Do
MMPMKSLAVCLPIVAALAFSSAAAGTKDLSPLDLARQLNEAFIEVADAVSPAVVVIEVTEKASDNTESDDGSFWDLLPPELRRRFEDRGANPHSRKRNHPRKVQGEGSGIVISPDGYILTNDHVVENADNIIVRFKDGKVYKAEVKGTDAESDIAVVKIKATGLTAAKLGDSDATRVGEFVLAIGAPFMLTYSVTVGHVSAKGRSFEAEMGGAYADQDFIQTDASINPGNSGGPLVNLYGEVIAVNAMIEGMNTGIGFAIPINLAKKVMNHLMNEGKYTRSWIGVGIGDLKNDRDYLGLDRKIAPDVQEGVVVEEIMPDGPASKSELHPGDVITAVDGKNIQTSRQLKDEIAAKKPGLATVLAVVRGREHLSIKVTPEALPNGQELASKSHSGGGPAEDAAFGLTVSALTKDVAEQYGITVTSGVIVTAVEQDSPADEQAIKAGDVITEVNRKHVSNPRQYREALKAADSKGGLMINLISDGGSRFVVLKDTDR